MNYIISASTDIGIRKNTNQDSLSIKIINTGLGRMTFSVLCDGVGGLAKGEVASASVVNAFNEWIIHDLPLLCNAPIEDSIIRSQWERIIVTQNEKIMNYGRSQGANLGTTVVAMLLTEDRYYIINVGDSRAYELQANIIQITKDQSVLALEIEQGRMTPEEAKNDPRRNVLLQCVGASNEVFPDMFFGETKCNAVYMLCSDGFIHQITGEEIFALLQPAALFDAAMMKMHTDKLIEIDKQRHEQDNISVALVRTF